MFHVVGFVFQFCDVDTPAIVGGFNKFGYWTNRNLISF
jgi:hypothetical protein